ncbi:MAG: FAD-dependent oxidoreductase, partial [Beijerinckiaceae bacterium]
MKSHVRVVVIGGGAMGVSLLYHLAERGWTSAVLVEKHELTAGSTWHAAGLCTHFAHNATIMAMRAHSVRLYRDVLSAETGLSTGFHPTGALRVTRLQDRMDEFHHIQGLGRFVGHDFHILSPDELKQIYPLCVTDGLIGAMHEPNDGHVDPSLATNAMAA